MDPRVNAALNIMRRMPPSKIEFNLSGLLNLMPDLTDELLQRVDQPLQAATDPSNGKQFLMCDYNRDGDSYRSPWSNEYDPPIDDGFRPSEKLRTLEQKANAVFDAYRNLYYEGGVSSVYLWDLEEGGGFAGCFLIKKEVSEPQRHVSVGCWDSIHVMEVTPGAGGQSTYKLTTTVMLTMTTKEGNAGMVNLSGGLTRQGRPETLPGADDAAHVVNMGKMIEQMEIDIRNQLDSLYIQKTRDVVNSIRKPFKVDGPGKAFMGDLTSAIMRHGGTTNA